MSCLFYAGVVTAGAPQGYRSALGRRVGGHRDQGGFAGVTSYRRENGLYCGNLIFIFTTLRDEPINPGASYSGRAARIKA